MNIMLAAETNLVFGRMNIDIDRIRGNVDEDHRHGKLAFDQALGVALKHRMLNRTVPDESTIDVHIQPAVCSARHPRG